MMSGNSWPAIHGAGRCNCDHFSVDNPHRDAVGAGGPRAWQTGRGLFEGQFREFHRGSLSLPRWVASMGGRRGYGGGEGSQRALRSLQAISTPFPAP